MGACEVKYLGGFGKVEGNPPDILHSFYSLCWRSLSGFPGVAKLHCGLVIRADRAEAHFERQQLLCSSSSKDDPASSSVVAGGAAAMATPSAP